MNSNILRFFKIVLLVSISITNIFSKESNKVEKLFSSLNLASVRDFTLSTDKNEAYFTILSPQENHSIIVKSMYIDNKWMKPTLVSFSGEYRDLEPFLSENGLKLYFASNRPITHSSKNSKDFDIWYVTRTDFKSKWGDPINVGAPVNTTGNEFYPSVSTNNNLYFTNDSRTNSKGKDDIFVSTWDKDKNIYSEPESMSESVNSPGYEFNSFIAPDESYILFTGYGRKDAVGSGDIYISFKNISNNSWSKAINLGSQINSKSMDYCPFVDIDSSSLYFTSKRSEIDNIKFNSVDDFLDEINKYENGLSRVYKISFKNILTSLLEKNINK